VRGARPAGLKLLVIQPTALCNLDCVYCYVPDRTDPRRLSMPLMEKLLVAVRESQLVQDQEELDILWHAGEPLAAGIDFYREAFAEAERILGDRWEVRHSIQTNGTLITEEWCQLFRVNGVSIGVSLDGPARIHDANRKTRGRRGSFPRVMRGIELLRAADISISILCVLTSESIDCADELFQFFVTGGFRHIAFNIEETEGTNVRSSLAPECGDGASARGRYRTFMTRLAELNRDAGWPLRVREFISLAQAIEDIRRSPMRTPVVAEQHAGAILTMTRQGDVCSWSPELASGVPGALDRFVLGNIRDVDSVDELLLTERAATIQREIDSGVEMCRRHCYYFSVCGGGSPANKFYERGTFAATDTLKCALQVQELTEVIISSFAAEGAEATKTAAPRQP
jgi:uncharacterized protein